MKGLFIIGAMFVISSTVFAKTNLKDAKNTKIREPAKVADNGIHLSLMERGYVSKYTDPENGTICYVASQGSYDGGVAIQCFPKR